MNTNRFFDDFSSLYPDLSVSAASDTPVKDCLTLSLTGSLDNNNAHSFTKDMETALKESTGLLSIRLELSKLKYISSTGVGALATIAMYASGRHVDFLLVDAGENVLTVLSLLGFDKFLAIENSSDCEKK